RGLDEETPFAPLVAARERAAAREFADDAVPKAVDHHRQPAGADELAQLRRRGGAARRLAAPRGELGEGAERGGEVRLMAEQIHDELRAVEAAGGEIVEQRREIRRRVAGEGVEREFEAREER